MKGLTNHICGKDGGPSSATAWVWTTPGTAPRFVFFSNCLMQNIWSSLGTKVIIQTCSFSAGQSNCYKILFPVFFNFFFFHIVNINLWEGKPICIKFLNAGKKCVHFSLLLIDHFNCWVLCTNQSYLPPLCCTELILNCFCGSLYFSLLLVF